MEQRVLGYDARESGTPISTFWPEHRRRQYLLRPDVPRPLSTDPMVWPSVFRDENRTPHARIDGLEPPAWTGMVQDLWDELARLESHLNGVWGTHWPPCRLIAVTLVYGLCMQEERKRWDERIVGIAPPDVNESWEFLGYDVSDEWLLSGLANCGYDEAEIDALRRRWSPHLNEHHLFEALDQAAQFATLSDERVSEHAPFFAYGIYSIPRSG